MIPFRPAAAATTLHTQSEQKGDKEVDVATHTGKLRGYIQTNGLEGTDGREGAGVGGDVRTGEERARLLIDWLQAERASASLAGG